MTPGRAFDWYVRAALVVAAALVVGLTLRSRSILAAYDELYIQAETPHAGIFVPPMEATTLAGEQVLIGEPEDPAVQVLYYFTTTCQYCRASIPAWEEIATYAVERGVAAYGISLSPAEEAAAYVAEHGIGYPVVTPPHPKYRALYRTRRVPQTLVVDGDGRVVLGRSGVLTDRAAVDSVLAAVTQLAEGALVERPVVIR